VTVVVSTHLDDAVLSCWDVLAGPGEVTVVTVYTGGPDSDMTSEWDRDSGVSSRVRMTRRVQENDAALAVVGAGVVNLGCVEGQYGDGSVDPDALRPHLERAESVFVPAGVFLKGSNVEHLLVRDVCLSIRPDATLYADQPYCLFSSELELPDGLRDGRRRVDVRLSASGRRRKASAIRCYAGELEKLEAFFGPFAEPAALVAEAYWRAPASTS
jgi:hypothetical protein